jgi:hypothetical protein
LELLYLLVSSQLRIFTRPLGSWQVGELVRTDYFEEIQQDDTQTQVIQEDD